MLEQKTTLLWWPRYVGDYQRKTAHLTLAEHGAYTLLLDHYYATSKPLPANASVLHRICRAFAPEEQAAVQSVIDQFFTLQEDGYHNKKADSELLKRGEISEKRKKAALRRHVVNDANAPANAPASAPANAYANAPANAYTTTTTTTTTNKSTAKSENISNTLDIPPLTPPLDELVMFEDFWHKYPNKVGKASARKAYTRARKEADHDTIIAGLNRYTRANPWRGELRFCKHPSTWLNSSGWLDQYPEPSANPTSTPSAHGPTRTERGILAAIKQSESYSDDF